MMPYNPDTDSLYQPAPSNMPGSPSAPRTGPMSSYTGIPVGATSNTTGTANSRSFDPYTYQDAGARYEAWIAAGRPTQGRNSQYGDFALDVRGHDALMGFRGSGITDPFSRQQVNNVQAGRPAGPAPTPYSPPPPSNTPPPPSGEVVRDVRGNPMDMGLWNLGKPVGAASPPSPTVPSPGSRPIQGGHVAGPQGAPTDYKPPAAVGEGGKPVGTTPPPFSQGGSAGYVPGGNPMARGDYGIAPENVYNNLAKVGTQQKGGYQMSGSGEFGKPTPPGAGMTQMPQNPAGPPQSPSYAGGNPQARGDFDMYPEMTNLLEQTNSILRGNSMGNMQKGGIQADGRAYQAPNSGGRPPPNNNRQRPRYSRQQLYGMYQQYRAWLQEKKRRSR